jgi:hypothetical protein
MGKDTLADDLIRVDSQVISNQRAVIAAQQGLIDTLKVRIAQLETTNQRKV